MRKIIIVILVLILSDVGNTCTLESTPVCENSEIIWFEATGKNLVGCWTDGTVRRWDVNTGELISHFRISDYEFYGYSHKLFVSCNDRPTIAVIGGETLQDDSLYTAVSFYDLLTGEQIKTTKIEGTGFNGHGFSKDGHLFFCSSYFSCESVLCIDTQTGKTIWRSVYPLIAPLMQTCICGTGLGYVNFFSSAEVEARNSNGELIWRWEREKPTDWLELAYRQPTVPSDIVLVLKNDDTIAAMSLTNGSILWEKSGVELCTASVDRKKQVFYTNDTLEIWSLPENKFVSVPQLKERCEAVFTETGEYLLCLPTLEIVEEDEKANTCKFARKSNILKVVDCKTGQVVRQFELKKP